MTKDKKIFLHFTGPKQKLLYRLAILLDEKKVDYDTTELAKLDSKELRQRIIGLGYQPPMRGRISDTSIYESTGDLLTDVIQTRIGSGDGIRNTWKKD